MSITSHIYKFLPFDDSFKVSSFRSFQIYNTVWLTIITMFHIISPELIAL